MMYSLQDCLTHLLNFRQNRDVEQNGGYGEGWGQKLAVVKRHERLDYSPKSVK